jgi:hypothetical protein
MAFDFVSESHLDRTQKLVIHGLLLFLAPFEIEVEEGIFWQLFSAAWLFF